MFTDIKDFLHRNKYVLVLASGSPRRRMLLKKTGMPFIVRVPNCREHFAEKNIRQELLQNTLNKATCVKTPPRALIIAGDTVIVYNNRVLGKPKSRRDAKDILRTLSGKTHSVWTGIVVYDPRTVQKRAAIVRTQVTFRQLSEHEINSYLDTGEYKDKAGAYGIQGHGSLLVKKINGDYENVVGFPMNTVIELLNKICREEH